MELIFYILLALYLLWVLYVLIMNLDRARKMGRMTPVTWILGGPLVLIGGLLDSIIHITIGTIIFWDLPRELTLSRRLNRYFHSTDGWRKQAATWIGTVLLNPFDPEGDHIS